MLPQRLLWLLLLALVASAHRSSRIRFHDNAYSGITVSLSEGVTASQREPLIKELQVSNRIRVERRSSLLLLCYCTAVAAAKTPVHSSLSLSLSLSLCRSCLAVRSLASASLAHMETGAQAAVIITAVRVPLATASAPLSCSCVCVERHTSPLIIPCYLLRLPNLMRREARLARLSTRVDSRSSAKAERVIKLTVLSLESRASVVTQSSLSLSDICWSQTLPSLRLVFMLTA